MAFPLPRVVSALLLCGATAAAAHASDLVTLRSGFTVECARREAISETTVRLYLRAGDAAAANGTAVANYMDVPAASIASVEASSDPVAAPALAPSANVPDTALLLEHSGAAHNVNVALLAAVVKAESAGNARAISRTGARGLMQLMPATAASLGVADSFSPEANVNGGSTYLDRLLTRYHDNPVLAVAAYNAGPGAVDRFHGVPPYRETRAYVARVIREFNRLAALQPAPPLHASR